MNSDCIITSRHRKLVLDWLPAIWFFHQLHGVQNDNHSRTDPSLIVVRAVYHSFREVVNIRKFSGMQALVFLRIQDNVFLRRIFCPDLRALLPLYGLCQCPDLARNLNYVPAEQHPDRSHSLPKRDTSRANLRRREIPSPSSR